MPSCSKPCQVCCFLYQSVPGTGTRTWRSWWKLLLISWISMWMFSFAVLTAVTPEKCIHKCNLLLLPAPLPPLPPRIVRCAAPMSCPGSWDGPLHPPDAVLHHLWGQAIRSYRLLLTGCKPSAEIQIVITAGGGSCCKSKSPRPTSASLTCWLVLKVNWKLD